jgi:hypothetical protein
MGITTFFAVVIGAVLVGMFQDIIPTPQVLSTPLLIIIAITDVSFLLSALLWYWPIE